jgi:hypothetical protein
LKRLTLICFALLAVPLVLVACNDDDDDDAGDTTATATTPAGTPADGTDDLPAAERDQIHQSIEEYLQAAHDQDRDRLREHVADGVPDADLDRAMDQLREHQYELIDIEDIAVDGDTARVTIRLRDKDGEEVTRTLDFERDQDQWRIRDPELHE